MLAEIEGNEISQELGQELMQGLVSGQRAGSERPSDAKHQLRSHHPSEEGTLQTGGKDVRAGAWEDDHGMLTFGHGTAIAHSRAAVVKT